MYSFIYLIVDIIYRFKEDEITMLASHISYRLLISFFPFLFFLLTLAGVSSIDKQMIIHSLSFLIPAPAFEITKSIIIEAMETRNSNLMSFSFILTLWFASSGLKAVSKGINRAYDIEETRGYLKSRFISIISTLALGIIVILSFILLIFGNSIGSYINQFVTVPLIFGRLWDVLRYIIAVLILILVFGFIYYFIPCKKLKLIEVLPGATFSTMVWIVVSLMFGYYVDTFSNYPKVYGSIGGFFILIGWLYISSIVILMGCELNASLVHPRKRRARNKSRATTV